MKNSSDEREKVMAEMWACMEKIQPPRKKKGANPDKEVSSYMNKPEIPWWKKIFHIK